VAIDLDIETPFPRVSFNEVMNRFGIDKPDTRFDLELIDFTDIFKGSGFKLFANIISEGGVVKAMNAKGLVWQLKGRWINK
jgi:aspartyl-tRNA synthetase